MGISTRNWFGIVREKFLRSSPRPPTIILLHTNNTTSFNSTEDSTTREDIISEFTRIDEDEASTQSQSPTRKNEYLSKHEIAATKIQAYFRAHLARRAYRALKSLVKLQAVVRGVCVRRQARMALECMHALVRLQLTVRARQLLTGSTAHR